MYVLRFRLPSAPLFLCKLELPCLLAILGAFGLEAKDEVLVACLYGRIHFLVQVVHGLRVEEDLWLPLSPLWCLNSSFWMFSSPSIGSRCSCSCGCRKKGKCSSSFSNGTFSGWRGRFQQSLLSESDHFFERQRSDLSKRNLETSKKTNVGSRRRICRRPNANAK